MLEDHRHGYYGTLPVFTFIAHFDFVSGLVPDWIEAGSDAPMYTHNHESPELIYITKGSMSAEINGDRKTVREGDLMIISPYDLHSADFIDKTRTLEYCCLLFELSILSGCGSDTAKKIEELRHGSRRFPIVINGSAAKEIGEIMTEIERIKRTHIADSDHTLSDLRMSAGVCGIMACLLRHSFTVDSPGNTERVLFIRRADNYIRDHIAENISTSGISADLGFSKCYFCVLFKRYFGSTFTEYLNAFRINTAINTYRSTGGSFASIAKSVGFEDYAYFSRCFKKRTGMSPTGYFSADKNEV